MASLPPVLHGKVLYDFTAQGANQLSLQAGDTIKIIIRGDAGGWSKGEDKNGIL